MNNIKYKLFLAIGVILIGCAASYTNQENITGYNLTRPDMVLELPDTLREISGLTEIDTNTFACVQDENGIIFIYDILDNRIVHQFNFHIDGDYEGITRVDSSLYILRSDGVIFEISNYQSPVFKVHNYNTGIPASNNEGLCYDPDNRRLLIAVKGKIARGPEYKDQRAIYSFDLETKKLSPGPILSFDVKEIQKFAAEYKVSLPVKTRKKDNVSLPFIRFMTSAIAVHPVNKKLYLLSAADHLFFIFDMKGNIQHLEPLNPSLFNKSEGITFFANGDMLISNEAQFKKPTLLKFRYSLSE
jgi:hypothetical protein